MDEQQKRLAEELLFSEIHEQSFAKALFFGDFEASKVFPYPRPKVDQEFLEQIKKFAEEIDANSIDRKMEIPPEIRKALCTMGVMGMTVPRNYGGKGLSMYEYCKVSETLASRCASTALFVNVHQSIGLRALLLFGTEEQKKKWLPLMASGDVIGAFALTEPNAGSDAASVETKAVFDPEKNVYRINGRKQWITNGSIAGVLTVMAQTEMSTSQGRQNKITAFLVTPDMPGFKVLNRSLEKMGYRGTWTANLEFENMEVPAANILGEKGKGLKVALTVLDYGRTTFGATCTGAAKFLVDRAVRHAKTRYQFNRPIASFGLVKEKISKMASLTYAMDATTYLTAGMLDAGVEDIMLESAMLKVFASDALWQITYDTMQIYGGRCFFTDAPLERMMRDARLNMIGEGANEVMRAFIAAVGMRDVGLTLQAMATAAESPFKEFGSLMRFAGKLLTRLSAPNIPVKSPRLAKEARVLGQGIKRFGFAVMRVLARYREEVIEHQLDLNRISTAAMALYTSAAVLSKLDRDIEDQGNAGEKFPVEYSVGRFYCHRAMQQLHQSLDGLFDKEDHYIEKVSDLITGI